MMKSPPASPLEVSEAQFALQFLVVAFDAPSQLDDVDESRERHVFRARSRASIWSAFASPRVIRRQAIRRDAAQPVCGSRDAGLTRAAAKREDKGRFEPSRHSTAFRASVGRRITSCLAEICR